MLIITLVMVVVVVVVVVIDLVVVIVSDCLLMMSCALGTLVMVVAVCQNISPYVSNSQDILVHISF